MRRLSFSIAIVFSFVCLFGIAGLPPTYQTAASQTEDNYQLNQFEKRVVEIVNEERKKNGLKTLKISKKISKLAREKSEDMRDKKYFDHKSPTYGRPCDHMKKTQKWQTCGENIAAGQATPEEVMDSWMHSEGHRRNILDPDYKYIGVGFVEGFKDSEYDTYWTQQFYS